MNCKNLKIRSKNYKKYFYCSLCKQEVDIKKCKHCEFKEYKTVKRIRGKKHKQTKATEISKIVKEAVWYRDGGKCIFCHKKVSMFYANAHFIPRSAGGLGIPENIFTACENCHREQDNGLNSKLLTDKAENYLRGIYGQNWNIKRLIYYKYN